ncbi:hypothetical protein Sjap_022706 [Stephania japonica]|uniref:PUM-HD domain-containing protein n=1 Tax=Stephania japonica TaxID=461633 RepID=A0AAP0EY72_9MAGN
MNMPNVPNCIAEELKGDFVSLSKQQCGSNVVERILMRASREKVREIVNEIVEDPSVLALYQDQFGNYVIQKALQVTFKWPDIFDAVAKVVEENYSTLDTHMYGKRIVSCWAKMQNERRSNRLMASLDAQSNF